MRKWKRAPGALEWAVCLVMVAAACTQQAPTSAAPTGAATAAATAAATTAPPSEIVIAMNGEPGTLDWQQGFSPIEGTMGHNLSDGFVQEGPNKEMAPALATSWTFANDGMSVTMKLRANVKFHDGTPFNSEAVKFNYDRELDPNNEFNKLGTWRLQKNFAGNIKVPVEVVDELTVKINFINKLPPDLNLNYFITNPHKFASPTAIKAGRDKYPDKPIGTGAYKFASWDKGQRIVLERNPDWWGPKPSFDRVILVPITDPAARLAALRAGTVDVNMDIGGDQLDQVKNDSKFTAFTKPANHAWHVLLNQKTVPELKDKRVRQAFNYAVDKNAIVQNILGGQGTVSKCFMSGAYGEWVESSLAGFPQDINKAKQLMADAGFPDGKGFPALTMKIPTDATLGGKPVPMSEAIQSDLAKIGVKLTLEPSDFGAWVGKVGKGDFQTAVFSLTISLTDPDNALHGYVKDGQPPSFHNFGYWENDEYEKLFAQSRVTANHGDRLKQVKRMQQIACQEDPAAIWVEHANSANAAVKTKVKNITGINDAAMIFAKIEKN